MSPFTKVLSFISHFHLINVPQAASGRFGASISAPYMTAVGRGRVKRADLAEYRQGNAGFGGDDRRSAIFARSLVARGRGACGNAWVSGDGRFKGKKGLRPQDPQHLANAEDLHHALQVVRKHVKTHLSADAR